MAGHCGKGATRPAPVQWCLRRNTTGHYLLLRLDTERDDLKSLTVRPGELTRSTHSRTMRGDVRGEDVRVEVRGEPGEAAHTGGEPEVVPVDLFLDFGNTNTVLMAVAHEPGRGRGAVRPEVVPLIDREYPQAVPDHPGASTLKMDAATVIPSYALFLDLEGGEARVAIGEPARRAAYESSVGPLSFCAHPKRILFSNKPMRFETLTGAQPIPPWDPEVWYGEGEEPTAVGAPTVSVEVELDPDDGDAGPGTTAHWLQYQAAALFFRELFARARASLNAAQRSEHAPRKVIRSVRLTVPVTFTLHEVANLERCARAALRKEGLHGCHADVLCDEATAVAQAYLYLLANEKAGASARETWRAVIEGRPHNHGPACLRIMVIDVGGGTTDVAIWDYNWNDAEDRVNAQPVHIDGVTFGGDDFTEAVMRGLAGHLASAMDGGGAGAPERFDMSLGGRHHQHLRRALLDAFFNMAERAKQLRGGAEEASLEIRLDDAFLNGKGAERGGSVPFVQLDHEGAGGTRFLRGRLYHRGLLQPILVGFREVTEWCQSCGRLPPEASAQPHRPRYDAVLQHLYRLIWRHRPDLVLVAGLAGQHPLFRGELSAYLRGPAVSGQVWDQSGLTKPPVLEEGWPQGPTAKVAVSLGAAAILGDISCPVTVQVPDLREGWSRHIWLAGVDRCAPDPAAAPSPTGVGLPLEHHFRWPPDKVKAMVYSSFDQDPGAPRSRLGILHRASGADQGAKEIILRYDPRDPGGIQVLLPPGSAPWGLAPTPSGLGALAARPDPEFTFERAGASDCRIADHGVEVFPQGGGGAR